MCCEMAVLGGCRKIRKQVGLSIIGAMVSHRNAWQRRDIMFLNAVDSFSVSTATRRATSRRPRAARSDILLNLKFGGRRLQSITTDAQHEMGAGDEAAVRERLWQLYDRVKCMPLMVRLAWHDAGSYDAKDGSGGANASVRLELAHGCNAGLQKALDILEPIHAEFPWISYADLYQLASIVGIEYAGGPKIPFKLGRKDTTIATPDGRLPDGHKRMPHLREVFYRMGFNDREIVALSGAHTLGAGHKDRSDFDGPWTDDPLVFDNRYYKLLLEDNSKFLKLASDMALLDEKETADIVRAYADDQDLFFKDYTEAALKLSEFGFPTATAAES